MALTPSDLARTRAPALTVVVPVWVLAVEPERVSTPSPDLVRPTEVEPELVIWEAMVKPPEP